MLIAALMSYSHAPGARLTDATEEGITRAIQDLKFHRVILGANEP